MNRIETLRALKTASSGPLAARPAASSANRYTLYYATDTRQVFLSDGSTWTSAHTKLEQVSTDRLIGRDTAGTGDAEEIALGAGLEFTGSQAIRIADAGVTLAKLAADARPAFGTQSLDAQTRSAAGEVTWGSAATVTDSYGSTVAAFAIVNGRQNTASSTGTAGTRVRVSFDNGTSWNNGTQIVTFSEGLIARTATATALFSANPTGTIRAEARIERVTGSTDMTWSQGTLILAVFPV